MMADKFRPKAGEVGQAFQLPGKVKVGEGSGSLTLTLGASSSKVIRINLDQFGSIIVHHGCSSHVPYKLVAGCGCGWLTIPTQIQLLAVDDHTRLLALLASCSTGLFHQVKIISDASLNPSNVIIVDDMLLSQFSADVSPCPVEDPLDCWSLLM